MHSDNICIHLYPLSISSSSVKNVFLLCNYYTVILLISNIAFRRLIITIQSSKFKNNLHLFIYRCIICDFILMEDILLRNVSAILWSAYQFLNFTLNFPYYTQITYMQFTKFYKFSYIAKFLLLNFYKIFINF